MPLSLLALLNNILSAFRSWFGVLADQSISKTTTSCFVISPIGSSFPVPSPRHPSIFPGIQGNLDGRCKRCFPGGETGWAEVEIVAQPQGQSQRGDQPKPWFLEPYKRIFIFVRVADERLMSHTVARISPNPKSTSAEKSDLGSIGNKRSLQPLENHPASSADGRHRVTTGHNDSTRS
jgi:hypothetical protein